MIRNGDLVQFQTDGNVTKYGIVITPACDLEQKHTKYLELIELKSFEDPELALNTNLRREIKEFKHPFWYFFPAIRRGENVCEFVAIFKAKIILEHNIPQTERYRKTAKRMDYSNVFLFQKSPVTLTYVCSFDDPYKSDFLQKLHAHNSRVGIPDIKKLI